MNDKALNLLFYAVILITCGLGEYFHLIPMGTLSLVIGGILGHGISANSYINATNVIPSVVSQVEKDKQQ